MNDLPTPDYYSYPWFALEAVRKTALGGVIVAWSDGQQLECHPLWLRENAPGPDGIDPRSKENDLDVTDLDMSTSVRHLLMPAP